MTILVTGATGNVGGHLVRVLTARGVPVRALVRRPARSGEITGDFADRASLDRALAGADQLFLACGNVPGQVEYECAAIDAAVAAGVRRIVKLSGPDASPGSPLLFERWHGAIEQHLATKNMATAVLRPSTYLTNLLAYAGSIARTGMLFAPAGTAAISFVDPRDVAEAAAELLTGDLTGIYTLTGPEAVTYERIAAELSAATGRTVSYVPVSDDDARRAMTAEGMPPETADAIVAIFAAQRSGRMAGVTDTIPRLTGRPARTLAGFARDYAAAFRPIADQPATTAAG
ncbi:SDR family oxidoreductase [Actinoplanes sp. NPDC024001]|uniref:SDR family oxidoreductase n=1 Tax=Actinoplanes sp. NPDC024001 TaxID=3154598 RepID=UPI0033F5AC4D